jgi:hypothetical protein
MAPARTARNPPERLAHSAAADCRFAWKATAASSEGTKRTCHPREHGKWAPVAGSAGFSDRPWCTHGGVSRCHRLRLVVCPHGTTRSLAAPSRCRAGGRGGVRRREPRRLSPWATPREAGRPGPAIRAGAFAVCGSPGRAGAWAHHCCWSHAARASRSAPDLARLPPRAAGCQCFIAPPGACSVARTPTEPLTMSPNACVTNG